MRRVITALLSSLVALSAFAVSAAHANDTWVAGIGGTMHPVKGEHPAIRMVRETVRMDLYPEYYDTVVTFTFANAGSATTVTMGFPEDGYVGVDDETARHYRVTFQKFSTTVDGKTVSVKRTRTDVKDGDLNALWVKQVPFAANQQRIVEVRYRSPYGRSSVGGLGMFASYHFTGQNWRGKVAESRLEVTSHLPGTLLVSGRLGIKVGQEPIQIPLEPNGAPNRSAYVWRNWEADGDFTLALATAPAGWLTDSAGEIPGVWSNTAASIQTLTVPEKTPTNRYHYCPPAFRRNGVTYTAIGSLDAFLDNEGTTAFDPATKTASYTVSGHTFTFPMQGAMTVDGKPVSSAASALYITPVWMGYPTFYVPLEPVAAALKRNVVVNASARRVTVTPSTGPSLSAKATKP
jgi:hypothetical protein